jgi:hypothetical protein
MNTRPIVNIPTPKAPWIPRHGRPIRTPLDLLIVLAVAAVLAATLLLFM